MRLIITGASGFIGRNLITALPKSWQAVAIYNRSKDFPFFVSRCELEHVHVAQCDLTNRQEVAQLAKRVHGIFDACIYLASNGDPALSVSQPVLDLSQNVLGLLHFLSEIRVHRLVFMSSGAVYDGLVGSVSPQVNIRPALPYAISKWAAERYVEFFSRSAFPSKYINVRFFGAFGPHEPERKIYTRLVRDFALRRARHFVVRGDGRNLIDAMFVDDAVDALLRMVESEVDSVTVDLCSGRPLSITELVQKAAHAFDVDRLEIEYQGSVPEYIQFRAQAGEARRLFGFEPRVGLEQGLRFLASHLRGA